MPLVPPGSHVANDNKDDSIKREIPLLCNTSPRSALHKDSSLDSFDAKSIVPKSKKTTPSPSVKSPSVKSDIRSGYDSCTSKSSSGLGEKKRKHSAKSKHKKHSKSFDKKTVKHSSKVSLHQLFPLWTNSNISETEEDDTMSVFSSISSKSTSTRISYLSDGSAYQERNKRTGKPKSLAVDLFDDDVFDMELDNPKEKDFVNNHCHRKTRYSCNECSFTTKKQKHYSKHLAVCWLPSVEKKWEPVRLRCAYCSFVTYLQDEFDDHLRIHTVAKPYQCEYCPRSFFNKYKIKSHLKQHHLGLPEVFKYLNPLNVQDAARGRVKPKKKKILLNPVVKLTNVSKLSPRGIKELLLQNDLESASLFN